MERREEYSAYIGPNAGAYPDVFSRVAAAGEAGYGHGFAVSWNWPAFFCGVWWYLYRKMYLWAAVDFGLSVVLGWTFFVPLLWAVARAVTGNYLYFLQAERKIREAAAYPSAGSAAGGGSGAAGGDAGAGPWRPSRAAASGARPTRLASRSSSGSRAKEECTGGWRGRPSSASPCFSGSPRSSSAFSWRWSPRSRSICPRRRGP